jgi:FixJ family two-component response regulator
LPAQVVHVVDDDASVRRSLTRLLSANGFEVADFASADEFLASGAAQAGGCVVLDHEMPGLSGLDLQQRLLAGDSRWETVFMSGHAEIRQRVEQVSGGASEFLAKPAKPADLIAAVRRALARLDAHRANDSAAAPRSLRRK